MTSKDIDVHINVTIPGKEDVVLALAKQVFGNGLCCPEHNAAMAAVLILFADTLAKHAQEKGIQPKVWDEHVEMLAAQWRDAIQLKREPESAEAQLNCAGGES